METVHKQSLKMKCAVHEAAHFLAFMDEGVYTSDLSIIPNGMDEGRVNVFLFDILADKNPVAAIFCVIVATMAANRYTGIYEKVSGNDARMVSQVNEKFNSLQKQAIMDESEDKANRWLEKNFYRVQWLANNLMIHEEMNIYEIKKKIPGVLLP